MEQEKVLELAAAVQEIRNNLSATNLLETVSVDENTHSRILRMILSYRHHGACPFYKTFLKIDKVAKILPEGFQAGVPHFFNERDRIDLLIEGKDYGIIIENKVYDAVDQERQLERYLDACIGRSIPKDRLYVIYLTRDGAKKVSEESLTQHAKNILGLTADSAGRFVEVNFRYDIVRWLRECIVLCEGEDYSQIKSALIQYTDYVLSMFDEGENTSRLNENMDDLFNKHDIRTIGSFSEYIDAANVLSAELAKRRDKLCRFLGMRFISRPLREYCLEHGIELIEESFSYSYPRMKMSVSGRPELTFVLEPHNGRIFYGLYKSQETINPISSDTLLEKGFFHDNTWAAWRYPSQQNRQYEYPATPAFWEVAVAGGGFVQFVVEAYEQTIKLLARGRQGVR